MKTPSSRDLCNTKTTIFGAAPGAIPGVGGNHMKDFHLPHAFSERFFKNWGGPRASELFQSSGP